MRIVGLVVMTLMGFGSGLFYGVVAKRIARGQEPWFTLVMLFGLWLSGSVVAILAGVSPWIGAVTFGFSSVIYLAMVFFWGRMRAQYMFYVPHLLGIMLPLVWAMAK